MEKITAFIFDLDGVITDTSEFHYQAWQHLADDEGIPFSRAENENLRGVSRRESLVSMLKGRIVSEEILLSWMERKNQYYLDLINTLTPANVLPGVLNLLDELKNDGIKSAIASASKNAPMVIEKLSLKSYFDIIVDGSSISKSKPAPDLFLVAAAQLKKAPEQCVVFEDATAGIEAAESAGMSTVGLGPIERVGFADIVLPDLQNIHLADILHDLESN